MLIALDYSIADVQHRLGHRKPDTTLRIYTHQWRYHDGQKSRIGDHIGRLFTETRRSQLQTARQLALPPVAADQPSESAGTSNGQQRGSQAGAART
jgi:hypothetical protein